MSTAELGPTTRAEVDDWVSRVAESLPTDELREVWLSFPKGVDLKVEMASRMKVLGHIVEAVERGDYDAA